MHSRAPLLTVSVELNAFLHQCIHGGRDHLARWCIAVPTSVTPTEVLPSPCARSIEGLRVSEACIWQHAGDNGTHVMMFGCASRRKVAKLQS
jgi:hypothetical protein